MRPSWKSSVLEQVSEGAWVAIVRLRSLGDCVLTTPAVHLLKQARPDLRIAMVVEPRFAAVYTGNPDIDRITEPKLGAVARLGAELTLNLHGGVRSAQLTLASQARWRAGFAHFRLRSIYNIRIPRAQEILGIERTVHTAEHLASAMFYLGVPPSEIPRARLFAAARPQRDAYAVIHPLASAPDKTWPAERFLQLARYLEAELQLEPVFIAGPGESLAAFERYRTLAGVPLEETKNLLAGASLFVGNDSGPAHMAAAFGLPVAVLFGASKPAIWSPWKAECAVLRSREGIAAIPVEEAMEAVRSLAAARAAPCVN